MTTVHDYIATLPEDSIESPYGNILENSAGPAPEPDLQRPWPAWGGPYILEQLG